VEDTSSELRMFLQGICCDYLLFRHLDEGVPPEAIRIRQEVALGAGAFADIEVRAGQAPPYFVEVDVGYSPERLLQSVRRKYGASVPATDGAARVVVAADGDALGDRPALERSLRKALRPGLALEIWDQHHMLQLLGKRFGVPLGALGEDDLLALRDAVDHTKGIHAFGDGFANDPLQAALLWHLAFWRVRPFCERPVGACPVQSCRQASAGMSSS
jgi:hypothetical protein